MKIIRFITALSWPLFLLSCNGQSNKPGKGISATDIDSSWYGNYNLIVDCGVRYGQHAEWVLNITITKDSVIAKGKGYETNFEDELIATADGTKLILEYKRKHPGFDSSGAKGHPEFLLLREGKKYYIQSGWLESDEIMLIPKKLGFEIKKQRIGEKDI